MSEPIDSNNEDQPTLQPWEMPDAGMSDEFAAAEAEAKNAVLRLVEKEEDARTKAEIARAEPSLVKRARMLKSSGNIMFPEEKPINTGGVVVMQPLLSDRNFYAVYDALFGSELPYRPHFDTFRGMPVDYDGEQWDERKPIGEMMDAIGMAGLMGIKASEFRRTYRDWILNQRMNDLEYRFKQMLPEWDGVSRLDTLLMDLMQPTDTELNREFGRYFWLSIYNRVTNPGCFAPMALALFGVQNAGKSYLSKLICMEVTGKTTADSVPLDLAGDRNTFLRAITGSSIIANVGEMTGFTRGDLNKIKDFMTRTTDLMDHKYEKHIDQPRQWIVVMDGNKYEGLQRDETGNRRLYPMFCGQLEDKNGQPHWRDDFRVNYDGFAGADGSFWQVMSEAGEWIKEHGQDGYTNFVRAVSDKVKDFSQAEMSKDRGTVKDDNLDAFLMPLLRSVKKSEYKGTKKNGVVVFKSDIIRTYDRLDRKGRLIPSHLVAKMAKLGGVEELIKNSRCFFFPGLNLAQFERMIGIESAVVATELPEEVDEWQLIEERPGVSEGDDGGGGFF